MLLVGCIISSEKPLRSRGLPRLTRPGQRTGYPHTFIGEHLTILAVCWVGRHSEESKARTEIVCREDP